MPADGGKTDYFSSTFSTLLSSQTSDAHPPDRPTSGPTHQGLVYRTRLVITGSNPGSCHDHSPLSAVSLRNSVPGVNRFGSSGCSLRVPGLSALRSVVRCNKKNITQTTGAGSNRCGVTPAILTTGPDEPLQRRAFRGAGRARSRAGRPGSRARPRRRRPCCC